MTNHIRRIVESQRRAATRGALSMWTIYDHPTDFPDSFIARRFEVGGGHGHAIATEDTVQGDIDALRESFAKAGLICLRRNENDDPKIVETWL